jgi:hypothetical protein
MTCAEQRLVDAHFAGIIDPSEERTMRAHVVVCEACRRRYRRQLLVARLDPSAPSLEDRLARGLGFAPATSGSTVGARVRKLVPLVAAVAMAAAVLLVLRPRPREPMARGTPAALTTEPLSIYRVDERGAAELASGVVGRGDELAFAYRNLDDRPYLMVFALGEGGRVYWFHPAWSDERDRPAAVPIARDRLVHELPEAIRHRPTGDRLEVHALFLNEALTVQDVEAALRARATGSSGPLEIRGGIDRVVMLALRP